MSTSVSERLRRVREAAGIAGRELDRLAGLGAGHSAMIETGRRANLTHGTARALARALGCTVGWLLEGEGDAPPREVILAAIERARVALASAHSATSEAA